jgi:hypothetical protein
MGRCATIARPDAGDRFANVREHVRPETAALGLGASFLLGTALAEASPYQINGYTVTVL